MRPELPEERDHGFADGLMLLTSLCVAVATWSYLANSSTAPLWKFYGSLGPTFFFALAGLTRRADWANAIRFLTGIWTITTPFLLGLTMNALPLWICLTVGVLLTALSVPEPIKKAVIWCGSLARFSAEPVPRDLPMFAPAKVRQSGRYDNDGVVGRSLPDQHHRV